MHELPELYEPMKLGRFKVPNRLMMAGMSAGTKTDSNGEITPEMIAYYVERARGEPGMIAIGASQVIPPKKRLYGPHAGIALYSDDIVPSLSRLVDAVHEYNVKFGIQLWNGGGTEGTSHEELMSPSGLSSNVRSARGDDTARSRGQPNRALEQAEIADIVEHFASAARRGADAGFDFVEIHAGHGYLISNFLTPLFNKRRDEYGGSFENRTRFLLEIVSAVSKEVGDRIAVGLKYNGDDFLGEDGWTLEESCRLAPIAEKAGADYITVTAGLVGSPKLTIPPMYEPQGCYTDLAAAVKPHVSIPVGTIGRIKNPEMARDLVAAGKADFVCFGRGTIADPDIFLKTREGRLEDIRPCLADCRGCIDEHLLRNGGGDASCVVNPRMSRELTCIDIPGSASENPKTVLVVGGGLAGMEAARMTAFSGHRVVLCERRSHLGGQILLARRMPGRNEIGDIVPWYERQLNKMGVDVRLGTDVSLGMMEDLAPDVVFIATGSAPVVPQDMMEIIMNAEDIDILMLDDLVEDNLDTGDNILVVGGDQNGMVIADYLAERNKKVTVAEALNHFGGKLAAHDRWYLLNRQNSKNVRRIKNVHHIEIDPGTNAIKLLGDGSPEVLPNIDTIVFASDRRSERGLVEAAEALGAETFVVGDAHDISSENAGTIFNNIAHAYDTARQV
ncbi:oxidoreductase [Henriciella aquimarina]|uniref:oxidoreductase n=1 Tax=Henriciella aquimarina TaxID=545261 RepID=UPI000A0584D9|nr:FAD-dependent oxidoreductase [Henriciella aquimarina]